MDRAGFRAELRRMADANGVVLAGGLLARESQLVDAIFRRERQPEFVNIFQGARPQSLLVITASATYAFELRMLSARVEWVARHDDVVSVQATHREVDISITDGIVLVGTFGRAGFEFGLNSVHDYDDAHRRVAQYNCEVAVAEIDRARMRRRPRQ